MTIQEAIGLQSGVAAKILDELKIRNQALRLYRERDWDMAELQMIDLQEARPERPLYGLNVERVAPYRKSPLADDWCGGCRFETK